MRVAFAIHAFAGARIAQHLNGAEFEDAGTDAFQHIRFRLPLDDDAVDSMAVQQMGEEQASRAAADDRDLGPTHHEVLDPSVDGCPRAGFAYSSKLAVLTRIICYRTHPC